MASWEIHKRTANIFANIWWKWVPGVVITVKWPYGLVPVFDSPFNGIMIPSADPNDHYRPWLESFIGKQGSDWDWRIGDIESDGSNRLVIKLKNKHSLNATIIRLKWA